MISETEKQEDVETENFDEEQPDSERVVSYWDTNVQDASPPTLRKVSKAQENGHACTQAALTIDLPKSMFTVDTKDAELRIATIDGVEKRYIRAILRECIPQLRYHFLFAGHTGEQQINDTMRQHFYRPILPTMTPVQWPSACREHGIGGLTRNSGS